MPGYIKPPSNQYIYSSSTVDGARIMTAASDYGFRNKIINGDFSVWQRGTSFSPVSNGAFTADRMYHVWDGSGATRNVTQQSFANGTVLDGVNPQYHLRYNQSVAGSGGTYNVVLAQKIEDVRMLGGQTVTVSFWAKSSSAITLPVLNYWHYLGSGGSGGNLVPNPNYSQVAFGQNTSVTTTWRKFSYTFTMPSLSGTNIGSGAYGYFEIYGPLNSTFTFDIWGLQLEAGSTTTNFEQRPQQVELSMCQRYYQTSFPNGTAPQNNIAPGYLFTQSANANLINGFPFFVPMRATPSFTTYNPYANNSSWRSANGATDIALATVFPNGNLGISYISTSGYTVSGSNSVHGHWAASAEL